MNLNKAILCGRVTRDPELKTTPGGTQVVSVGIATNNTYTDKQGKKVEDVSFHNLVIFGKTAEIFAQYVVKGQEVLVEGRIQYRKWTDKQGAERQVTEVLVNSMQMGQKPAGAARTDARPAAAGPALDEPVDLHVDEDIKPEDIEF